MATNSVQGKRDQVEEENEEKEEEEEEALSLCDLPITLINHKDQDQSTKEDSPHINETQEEFDFRSWGGLFSKEPEMCAADDVFFQGQILPLRFSFSSDSGLITKRNQVINHISEGEFFQSNSSRSSSVRSQNSSSSSTTSSTTTNTTTTPRRISIPRIRNQFHTHPSPKPQLRRISGPRQTSTLSSNQGRKSSSTWEFFRLGVVPAPEIALQDLKLRSSNSNSNSANKNCVSRNSSNSSSSSISTKKSVKIMSNKSTHHDGDKNNNHHVFKQLMRGCKCSVETVGSDIVMIKGGTKSTKKKESTQHAVKEEEKGVVELKKQKHRSQKQGKKVMSRRRTFEWLKELHACHPDEEALLSNP